MTLKVRLLGNAEAKVPESVEFATKPAPAEGHAAANAGDRSSVSVSDGR